MSTKTVCQLDQDGYFLGLTEADESRVPEQFLIPFGCVDVPPPQIPAGQRARFVDGAFILEDIPPPQPDPGLIPPTHQEMVGRAMLGMKSKRLDIFRVLDTLQVDALTSSDQPRAQAIMQAKAALTAVNAIDLSAYQTDEAMEQAIQLAYWGIVSQAPQEVQDAFNALVPR